MIFSIPRYFYKHTRENVGTRTQLPIWRMRSSIEANACAFAIFIDIGQEDVRGIM